MRRGQRHRGLLVRFLAGYACVVAAAFAETPAVRLAYRFDAPEVRRGKDFDRIRVEGLDSLGREGAPLLPRKLARILLPEGSAFEGVAVERSEARTLPGRFLLAPAPEALSPEEASAAPPPEFDREIYDSAGPYPASPVEVLGAGWKHGRRVVFLSLAPVRYFPASGAIEHFESIAVEIRTRPAGPGEALGVRSPARAATGELAETVDNPEDALEGGTGASTDGAGGDADIAYAIVTSEALAPYFEPLAEARARRGLPARVFTMEWIRSSYDGLRPDGNTDDATRLRNFVIDTYENRGLRWLLLAGDADAEPDCAECEPGVVPTRYFQTEALFGGAIPSDLYFGCLDGTFDGDGDGLYGEPTDGPDGGDVDLLFEVHVGRAPVDSPEEAENFVRKTLAYEDSSGLVLREVLLVGEHLGFGGGYEWGGNLNDAIRTGSKVYIQTTGFEDSSLAATLIVRTLYDRDSTEGAWKPEDLTGLLERGVHVLNHVGHADASSVMKLRAPDIDRLRNAAYFLGYSQSCYAGAFDNRRADGSPGPDSVVEHFVSGPAGAAAFVANSRRGWAGSMRADGPSQRFDRRFWDAVLRLGVRQWGAANDRSKEESLADIATSERSRWCAYGLATFGDPALTIKFTSRRGSIALDREWYAAGQTAVATVADADLDASASARDAALVTVRSEGTGDEETFSLDETGPSSGVFQGTIPLLEGAAARDSKVEVRPPDTIVVRYADLDAGTGLPAVVSAAASVTRPLALAGACPPRGYLGVPYRHALEADGGQPPYRFRSDDGKGYVEVTGPHEFERVGVAQNWKSDEGFWSYSLPFSFPFYGELYDSVTVSSNGYLDLGAGSGLEFDNSVFRLIQSRRIAVLWADIVTGGGGDIYVDEKPGSVTFRWFGVGYHSHAEINCEVELFEDGAIRFGYGPGNLDLDATIGISAGDGKNYLVSSLSGSADLSAAPSVHFYPTRLPKGLRVEEASGAISGFPEEVGTYEVQLYVEDALGQVAKMLCTLQVHPDGLVIEEPREGDLWLAGSQRSLRWQWFGNIGANVRLDYNADGSTTQFPFPIAARVPLSDRSYLWRVPAELSPGARVRAQSVESPQFFTYSAIFSIVGPTIVLRSPAGGERWVVGETAAVRWENIGNTGARVRVAYATDGSSASFPNILAADAPNTGTLSAAVPATVSETCRLQVESLSDPAIRAVSPGLFAIRRPSITLLSPNGGECLRAGETVSVSWVSDGTTESQVLVEFNLDGGTSNFPYAISQNPLPNTGSASWTVPQATAPAARMRIHSYPRSTYSDVSDGAFSIAGRCRTRVLVWIPYIGPDEEQVLGIQQAVARFGRDVEIVFSVANAPATLAAELSGKDALVVVRQKDAGSVDLAPLAAAIAPILESFVARGGAVAFSHQVPASEILLRSTGLIEFRSLGEGTTVCEVLRPEHPVMAGVLPNFAGPFRTAWYEASGALVERLAGRGEGGTIVAVRPYGFGRVALLGFDYYAFNESTGRILANAVEIVLPPAGIRILEPEPGKTFLVGEPVPIRWIARGEAKGAAAIRYNTTGSASDFPLPIAEVSPAGDEGAFDWTVTELPAEIGTLDVRLRVQSVGAPQHADVLPGIIRIVQPLAVATEALPEAAVGFSYRAEIQGRGGVPPYTFALVGLPAGLIQRTIDDRTIEIVGVPQRECPDCEIRVDIVDAAGATARARLRLPVLRRAIELLRPLGGELFLYGTEQAIRWRPQGDVGETVSIAYNADGSLAEFPLEIAASVPVADGFWLWLLPEIDARNCRLRIQSNERPELYATSGIFSIVGPTIRLDAPLGGECWEPGKERTIRWRTATRSPEPIRIEYNLDGSAEEFPFVIAPEAPDVGEFRWVVDAPPTETCRVRVSLARAPATRDVSKATFRVGPGCRLSGLVWTPFLALEGERRTIVDGIRAHEEDLVVAVCDASTATGLASALANRDFAVVLLVDTPSAVAALDLGAGAREPLRDFVERGGVVVFCGANAQGARFAEASGAVARIASVDATDGVPCSLISYLHPIARDVPFEFTFPSRTYAYAVEDSEWEAVAALRGAPAIAAREEGKGRWVILGHDFGAPDAVAARIAANCVRHGPIAPGLRVLSPRAGSVFFSGDPIPVRWAARGEKTGAVLVSYNVDGSSSDFPLEAGRAFGEAAGGEFQWLAPEPVSGDHFPCRVQVRWEEEPALSAASEVFYVVREPLRIVTESLPGGFQNAPYASEVSAAGGARPYLFEALGLHAGLYLTAPEPFSERAELTGVPLESGTDREVTVRVRDALGLESERRFVLDIVPSRIEILSPAGGEYVLAGSTVTVRWQVQGYAGETFRIEYNLDGSARTFPFVAAESVPATASFSWSLPDIECSTVRLRILSNEISGLASVAERTFAISRGIACLFPNGGENLETRTRRTIRWRSLGNPGTSVRIDVNFDGSLAEFPVAVAEEAPDTGEYVWEVPGRVSAACRVRVRSVADPSIGDVSDFPFAISYRASPRALVWIPHAGFDALEVRGAVAAATIYEHDFRWVLSKATKPAELESELYGKEAFLMVEQQDPNANFKALARALGPGLEDFVRRGGAAIVLKQVGNARGFLAEAGLLQISEAGSAWNAPCRTAWPEHPIMSQVPDVFEPGCATGWYRSSTEGVEVYATTLAGDPVALGRQIGDGRVIAIGFDYRDYTEGSARILANALRNLQLGELPRFVRGDANSSGKVDLGDAIFILNFLFRSGRSPLCLDAADVDDSAELGGSSPAIDVSDAIILIRWLFLGGPPPAPPGPAGSIYAAPAFCGVDPTPRDGLDCAYHPPCLEER
ncbi:MAG: C25 family cysteine peptidase [Planctomycetota bacterium]